jgi:hypothetical protein
MAGLLPRLLRPPAGSFFRFGPRGPGKSTWLRRVFPQAHRLDLLPVRAFLEWVEAGGRFAAG